MNLLEKKISWLLVIILIPQLFIMTTCASLKIPAPSAKTESLLIIPIAAEKVGSRTYFIRYRLYFENLDYHVTIDPVQKHKVIDNLQPGDYKIIKRQSVYKGASKLGSRSDLNMKFTLKKGYITILPYEIYIAVKRNTKGGHTQYFSTRPLSKDRKSEIIAEISENANYDLWEIYTGN